MNKTVVLFELAGMTNKEYDAILEELKSKGELYNEDRLAHVAFEKDGKWCVVDVWNSPEGIQRFAENTLIPAFKKLGLEAPNPTVLPAYNWMGVKEELISA